MTVLRFPGGLAEIADAYDTILCDVWGVIHNGRAAFSDACDALVKFREQGGQVCLITNAPVPNAHVIRHFEPLGVPDAAFDDCVSSGDATRAELQARADQTVWRLGGDAGWEHDRFLYQGLDLTFVDSAAADLLLCIGLRDNVNDVPSDYSDELQQGVDRNLPMICANPDKQVRIGGKLYWCAGALAEIYEEQGGTVIYPGKPFAPIYQLAIARLTALGRAPQRILCIGDSPATDIRGASLQGYDSLYVGTGLKEHGANFQQEVTDLLADYGESATYALTGLRW
ncbi:TIGR01459 family HAD-type hydrolase [Hyphomonas johnsonii]|uniref:HAD family hydrolase n=1 Tax=Hyphomonas johnsonii MHS-2 TaxID=1280950 RepID=A0A059FFW2_9PROT|nr:TIGR01459 family HAD-type hydrolase [Hyphomonas johnsonii]KCZ89408.1 HAD family hydrolase [Hyphomonas johnsonii MHS-2]